MAVLALSISASRSPPAPGGGAPSRCRKPSHTAKSNPNAPVGPLFVVDSVEAFHAAQAESLTVV